MLIPKRSLSRPSRASTNTDKRSANSRSPTCLRASSKIQEPARSRSRFESARHPGALVYYDGVSCANEEQVAALLSAWPVVRRDPYRERWVNNPPEWREFVFRYDRGELISILALASSVATERAEASESETSKDRSAKASDQILKPEISGCKQHPTMLVAPRLFRETPLFNSFMRPSATSTSDAPHEIEAACNDRPAFQSTNREAPSGPAHQSLPKCAPLEMRSNDSVMSDDQTTVSGNAPGVTHILSGDTEAIAERITPNEEFVPTEALLTTEAIATSDAPAAKEAVSAPEVVNAAPLVLSDEPYVWAQCTIQVSLQILPESDLSSGDRKVILGVRTHEDAPLLGLVQLSDLQPLPAPLTKLLTQLAVQLPERAAAAIERKRLADEKTKAEEARRREATARAQAKRGSSNAAKNKPKTKPITSLNTFAHHVEPHHALATNVTQAERTEATPLLEAALSSSRVQVEPPLPAPQAPLEIRSTSSPTEATSGKIGDGQPSLF